MREKHACLISGNGAWSMYGGGTLARLNRDYDTVVGVSMGTIMSPLIALKEWEYLKITYSSINKTNIFDFHWYKPRPISNSGKLCILTVIITLLLRQKTIGSSNSLRTMIDKIFPENFYNELQKQSKEVLIGTQNFSEVPSKAHFFSSFYETYEDLKDWMWCGANYRFLSTMAKKSWRDSKGNFHVGQWSDGGFVTLLALDQLVDKKFTEIDIILNRPKLPKTFEGKKIFGLIDNISTGIETMRYDIEFECLERKIHDLNLRGTKVTVYWLTRPLSSHPMIFDEEQMIRWWEEGYITAFDENRMNIYEPISKWD